MVSNDELVSRLLKVLDRARNETTETQIDNAVHGVARLLENNLSHYVSIFAPIAPPPMSNDRIEALIAKNTNLEIELEKLKFQLELQQQAPATTTERVSRSHHRKEVAQRDARIVALQNEIAAVRTQGEVDQSITAPSKRGHSNFPEILGPLVNAARMGGMLPRAIFQSLNAFHQYYDGPALTPNMIYGVRLEGNPDVILPDGDPNPLTRPELVAMQTRLFGLENNIRPMIRFIITHVQPRHDITDYMSDDSLDILTIDKCTTLRKRFYIEMRLRAANPRYAKFARGLAMLQKRTIRRVNHYDDNHCDEVMPLATQWFGEEDAERCIAQLCGFDHSSIEHAVGQNRQFPQELRDTVALIKELVGDCNPDHPDFEKTVTLRVKAML